MPIMIKTFETLEILFPFILELSMVINTEGYAISLAAANNLKNSEINDDSYIM
jgi:hypothetical protein